MGNKAAADLQIKRLGEQVPEDDNDSASEASDSSHGTPKVEKKRSRLLKWRGGSSSKNKSTKCLKIVILVCIHMNTPFLSGTFHFVLVHVFSLSQAPQVSSVVRVFFCFVTKLSSSALTPLFFFV